MGSALTVLSLVLHTLDTIHSNLYTRHADDLSIIDNSKGVRGETSKQILLSTSVVLLQCTVYLITLLINEM